MTEYVANGRSQLTGVRSAGRYLVPEGLRMEPWSAVTVRTVADADSDGLACRGRRRSMRRFRPLHGFTLIELLVVISIISLLVSILLPSLNSAKELAKRSVCSAQLRAAITGMAFYVEDHDGHIPHQGTNLGAGDETGSRFGCLPESGVPGDRGVLEAWSAYTGGRVFYCPSNNNIDYQYQADYTWGGSMQWEPEPIGHYAAHYLPVAYVYLGVGFREGLVYERDPGVVFPETMDAAPGTPILFDPIQTHWSEEDIWNTGFSNHLSGEVSEIHSGIEPAGGNMGYLDSSVSWKPFGAMTMKLHARYTGFCYW